MGCAAALAVLEVIEEEQLNTRSMVLGALIVDHLTQMKQDPALDCIGEIRNLGAMVAVELVRENDMAQAAPELAKALVQEVAKDGLILLSCGVRGNVIRFLSPLTIPDAQVMEGMTIIHAALKRLGKIRQAA